MNLARYLLPAAAFSTSLCAWSQQPANPEVTHLRTTAFT
jgi:hypothetical protein